MAILQESALEQSNKVHYAPDRSDSFVIDMDGLMIQSSSPANKDIPLSIPTIASCRETIKLQRNLSRKGSQRFSGRERNVNGDNVPAGVESVVPAPSPKGPSSQERCGPVTPTGAIDHPMSTSTGNLYPTGEGRFATRKNSSLKRYSVTWAVDPRSVVLFFATLSSVGTMLLIYFTLSMSKITILENVLE